MASNKASFTMVGTNSANNLIGNEFILPLRGTCSHLIAEYVKVFSRGPILRLYDSDNTTILATGTQSASFQQAAVSSVTKLVQIPITPVALEANRPYRMTLTGGADLQTTVVGTSVIGGTNNKGFWFQQNFTKIGTSGTAIRGTRISNSISDITYQAGLYNMGVGITYDSSTGNSESSSIWL
jgi:hypothetical protein